MRRAPTLPPAVLLVLASFASSAHAAFRPAQPDSSAAGSVGSGMSDVRAVGSEVHQPVGVAVLAMGLLGVLGAGFWVEHRRRGQAEIEARQQLTALAHLDRRAALGELAASLAHELNQPLGAILLNAEAAAMLLESRDERPELLREIVDDIRRDDKRATEIIRRMRSLLRKQELIPEQVDVREIARDTVDLVGPAAGSRAVRVELDPLSRPAVVLGDRVHLQQVLMNLVMNGVDAAADHAAMPRRVTLCTSAGAGQAEIVVTDSGSGIPAHLLPHLFKPFRTTKADGLGIGLAIAHGIVEAHGGRIRAVNVAGGGAAFRVSLPSHEAAGGESR
jgi:signal transduction histidine kinase